MTYTPVLLTVAFLTSAFAAEIVPTRDTLVVHEWGTFTSVAGANGDAVSWAPLAETPDLPCFVHRLSPLDIKSADAMVRMETPVLYFYPQHEMNLSVHVAFPQGWITEWYPQATAVMPRPAPNVPFPAYRDGQIAWDGLHVSPGPDPAFPAGQGASRYYAARQTESAPISIGGQNEKMIFYRGIGNFTIPLRAAFNSQGALEIQNTGADTVPMAMWFENRDGWISYRMVRNVNGAAKLERPEKDATLDELRSTLAAVLVESGLYPKEAAAMIETWHDAWFEAGSRLIYIVPRPMVDAVLPLNVTPAATSLSRVFVGRIEVLSPSVRKTFESAIAAGDVPTMAKFGRFLEPFTEQIGRANHNLFISPAVANSLNQARGKVWESLGGRCIN